MAPPDHDQGHGERIAVVETVQKGHGDDIAALRDKVQEIEARIWWGLVAAFSATVGVAWQMFGKLLGGVIGK